MSLRTTLNEKPGLSAGVGGALIVVAAIAVYISQRGETSGNLNDEAFFSVDDGKSWFAADSTKLAPFDHEGKQAVRAYVFRNEDKTFVNHLERYTPEGKKLVTDRNAAIQSGKAPPNVATPPGGGLTEVKRPGDASWVSMSDKAKASSVVGVKSPGGGNAVAVEP